MRWPCFCGIEGLTARGILRARGNRTFEPFQLYRAGQENMAWKKYMGPATSHLWLVAFSVERCTASVT